MSKTVFLTLLRGFGTGYTPFTPGTAGSLLALTFCLPFWYLRRQIGVLPVTLSLLTLAILTGVLTWVGFKCCRNEWEEYDPSEIVLDEFAGTFLIVGATFLLESHVWIFVGFVLFRFFDMLKPFPIPQIERADRFAGLVLDDLMAAAMASLTTGAILILM